MSTFKIIKKGANNFWHWFNNDAKKVSISSFAVVLEEVSQTFSIVYLNGANVPQQAVNVLDIEVIDETDASVVETFTNVIDLRARLIELGYTAYLIGGGIDNITGLIAEGTNVTITGDGTLSNPYVISASGGGGAVDSVNGQTGVVVLDADDVGAEPTRGSNDNYVTDAQLVIIGNTSGSNSGDNATNTTSNSYADAKVVAELASFKTANFLDFTSSGQTQLDDKQDTLTEVNFGSFSNALAAKTTVVDADSINIVDSADSNKSKKVTLLSIWNYIKGKADSIYVTQNSWVDYSATSTIGGFASLSANILRYIEIGNFIYYYFNIGGVSNGATFTITTHVPHAGGSYFGVGTYNVNNGNVSINPPRMTVINGSSTITISRDLAGNAWTTSGNKQVSGMFVIQKT